MPLEDIESAGKYISDLVSSNPVGATDFLDDADNHMRGIKNVLKLSFPNINGAVNASPAELNILVGATLNVTELNTLTGVAVLASEINQLAGITGLALSESNVGVKSAGDLTFNDNVKLIFGTGGVESELYSDGVNTIWSFLTDKDLYINDGVTTRFWFDTSIGDFHADGDVVAFSTSVGSDRNLKDNIEAIPDAVRKVMQLTGVTFDWKKNGKSSAGLIAQDLEEVLPEAVGFTEDMNGGEGHLTVNYNAVVGLLVEAVKTQAAQIRALQRKVNA